MDASGLGAGVRIGWDDLPPALLEALAGFLRSPVVGVGSKVGGFSPGAALGLRLADGRSYFLKAVSADLNPDTPQMYRREIEVNAWLPASPSVPALRWTYDDGHWVALLFDHVDAATPSLPWSPDDLDRVLAALRSLHESATPAPPAAVDAGAFFTDDFVGWRRLAGRGGPDGLDGLDAWATRHVETLAAYEEQWAAAAAGDTLLHADLRADNVLVGEGVVAFVDWPWACRGAGWVDTALFVPSAVLQGAPPPGAILDRYGAPPVAELVPVVAALAGYFVERSLAPAVPGLPTLRAYQAAQAGVALSWLRELTGLP